MRTLDAAEVDSANICTVVESEDSTGLVESDVLGQAHNVLVESATDVVKLKVRQLPFCFFFLLKIHSYVGEDEGLVWIKADGNDILRIAEAIALNLLDRLLLGEQVPGGRQYIYVCPP